MVLEDEVVRSALGAISVISICVGFGELLVEPEVTTVGEEGRTGGGSRWVWPKEKEPHV